MAKPELLAADLLVAAEVPPEDEQAIVEAFGALGVTARARIVPTRRGVGELQWLVLAALPLQAFLSSLGSTLGDEASDSLIRLTGRLRRTRGEAADPPPPILVLQDAATRLQVVLEAGLPTDAYRALLALDLSTFSKGPLHYDQQHRRWRSELDEWQERQGPPPRSSQPK
jgi:hypothetical protein